MPTHSALFGYRHCPKRRQRTKNMPGRSWTSRAHRKRRHFPLPSNFPDKSKQCVDRKYFSLSNPTTHTQPKAGVPQITGGLQLRVSCSPRTLLVPHLCSPTASEWGTPIDSAAFTAPPLGDQKHIRRSAPGSNSQPVQPLKAPQSGSVPPGTGSLTEVGLPLLSVLTRPGEQDFPGHGVQQGSIFMRHLLSLPVPQSRALREAWNLPGMCNLDCDPHVFL